MFRHLCSANGVCLLIGHKKV